MTEAVPDCPFTGYEPLIDGLSLPDPEDRHVLAAAIRCQAQVIVTTNLKDCSADQLDFYDIEAQSPDEFVLNVIDLAPTRVMSIVQEQARQLANPPKHPRRPASTGCGQSASPDQWQSFINSWANEEPLTDRDVTQVRVHYLSTIT